MNSFSLNWFLSTSKGPHFHRVALVAGLVCCMVLGTGTRMVNIFNQR